MNQAVVCIAPDVSEAEKEVVNLRQAGFSTDDISVLWPDLAGAQELGYEQHTKAPEGIAWGVSLGALVGGVFAYLAATGVLWTQWSAQLLNAGPVLSALSGMAVGGMFGFFSGLFIGLAFPEYEAKKYERKIKIGSTLVAVHTDSPDEVKSAENALKKTAALSIHHIEETARCKPKASAQGNKNIAKTGTMLLLALCVAGISAARADQATPVSPPAKADEQKATMPPDVTTPTISDPAKSAQEKTAVQSQKTSQSVPKIKYSRTKVASKTRPIVK